MISFKEYYDPQVSLKESVKAISDPSLDHERNRHDVNKLLMNLVLRYVAEYLEVNSGDLEEIKRRAVAAVQNTKDEVKQMPVDGMSESMSMPQKAKQSRDDKLARKCLIDLRATAAIMKEIIFGGEFRVDRHGMYEDQFVGLDLGSGTGILMVAMAIAAYRKKIAGITVLGLDISREAVKNSSRTLLKALPDKQLLVRHANVMHRSVWTTVHDMPIHYLVSETVGPSTPPIEKSGAEWRIVEDPNERLDKKLRIYTYVDPFPCLFRNATIYRPQLEEDVRSGKMAMFPDIFTGRFTPNYENSTLALKTAPNQKAQKLCEVGSEFKDFETFDLRQHRRWQDW